MDCMAKSSFSMSIAKAWIFTGQSGSSNTRGRIDHAGHCSSASIRSSHRSEPSVINTQDALLQLNSR
ncbi:hypothetical protein Bca52824_053427 [Brassica carinata]|uniref:Uncharacterized protein n=1 Tax=Brassica carinata TaxID=52824 RepID=A0A8X7R6H5_BRACI|nr:hypothetical protein Bca52824_053427 [Brassica carinata]